LLTRWYNFTHSKIDAGKVREDECRSKVPPEMR
jgi:hypothetical protein